MHRRPATFLIIFIIYALQSGQRECNCLDNGLALTPPMGWMNWERFRCTIDCDTWPDDCFSEKLILETADRMAADGWLEAGYETVSLDDCWMAMNRSSTGELVADPKRFPRGMKFIGDYLHNKGLKFGIYEDFGTKTCAGYPGSEFYLEQDANTFAKWGVDYIKLDGCYSDPKQQEAGYVKFGEFLNATGRPIVYSCSWPAYWSSPADLNSDLLKKTCNLWRIYADIDDSWDSLKGIMNFWKKNTANFMSWSAPGHWNDPDMLIVGDFGLSYDQQRVQMAVWAVMPAPLIMSVDLRNIRAESRDLLQNRNLLRVNQDKTGKAGVFVGETSNIQMWSRQLVSSTVVVVVNTNTDGMPRIAQVDLSKIDMAVVKSNYVVIDVFTGKAIGNVKAGSTMQLRVNPTGAEMIELI